MEAQVVQAVLGLLSALVAWAVAYFSPKLKAQFHSATAGNAIDGLGKIAEAVVQDFNQRVVAEAKANGVFNAQLGASVKAQAIAAVKDQGANLVALADKTVGNADQLVSSLIESAVASNHIASK